MYLVFQTTIIPITTPQPLYPHTPPATTNPPQLILNRIKFNRKPAAPSIPTPGQAYGYEERNDGALHKQAPPNRDQSIGPAFYKCKDNRSTAATGDYKGNHFGKMTGKRSDFCGRQGPGWYLCLSVFVLYVCLCVCMLLIECLCVSDCVCVCF